MENIDLNPGGLIGALVCAGVYAAIVFSSVDIAESGSRPIKLIIVPLIGGAFAGNFLWRLVFKKPK
jgi:phosphate/sulfate permease